MHRWITQPPSPAGWKRPVLAVFSVAVSGGLSALYLGGFFAGYSDATLIALLVVGVLLWFWWLIGLFVALRGCQRCVALMVWNIG
jgi:hypothetical protein